MTPQPQTKVSHQEAREFLEKVLTHPLPLVRRELLDYLLRKVADHSYGLTLNLDGNISMLELEAGEWQGLVEQVLATQTQSVTLHSLELQALHDPSCTLLRSSLALGISKSKAQALRNGVQTIRLKFAPLADIFLTSLGGMPRKEVALKFDVTPQTISNVRSRVLDLTLYQAVQQFGPNSKVA